MNCRNFAVIVSDLARSELMDVSLLEAGRKHADECPRCEMRLADERELGAGLRALAAVDVERNASVAVEADLLAAFRQQARTGIAVESTMSTMLPATPTPDRSKMWWGIGVAATIAILLGGTFAWSSPEKETRNETAFNSPSPTLSPKPSIGGLPTGAQLTIVSDPEPPPANSRPRRKVRAVVNRRIDKSYVAVTIDDIRRAPLEHEQATDFIPMTPGAESAPMTSGRLMRVVMPRSAMTYFGLPMNVDRAEERVKADVLLGEDGLARAIRFVR